MEAETPSNTNPPGFWRKLSRVALTICLPLIAMGQWVDTKDLLVDGYDAFITNFTDRVELEKLEQVRVGGNLDYLEEVFGVARLIKQSDVTPAVEYRYYYHPKFLLTLAVDDSRIVGYGITSLREGFAPPIVFSDAHLLQQPIADTMPLTDNFNADSGNIHFYIQGKQMGKEGLYFAQFVSFIEYGAAPELPESEDYEFVQPINGLVDAYLLSQQELLLEHVEQVRSELYPNTYLFGQLDMSMASEMLLTRYEYSAYFTTDDE